MTENDSFFEWLTISSIELLGYAKNNILEAIERKSAISEKDKAELLSAFSIIDKVQEKFYAE